MNNNFDKLKKFWKGKKVFITGHTGFKGSWLSLMLSLLGAKVYGYSLKPNKKQNVFDILKIKKKISSSTIGDIRDYSKLKKKIITSSPDFIVHMAAQPLVIKSYNNPKYTYEVNINGTLNLLNVLNETQLIKYALIITTDKVYLNNKKKFFFKETDQLGGFDPYSNSKACTELIVSSFNNSFFNKKKIFAVTARAGNIIGGGDFSENRIIPDFFRSLESKKKLLLRNPQSVRPWQHILEPLYGYMLILMKLYSSKKNFKEPCFNFGPKKNNNVVVEKLINQINHQFSNSVKIYKNSKSKRHHESNYLALDSNKSIKNLNWKPQYNFKKSIELVANWHKEYMSGNNMSKVSEQQIINYINYLK